MLLRCRWSAGAMPLAVMVAVWSGVRAGRAQALADRMPTDALVYAGWSGSDALGPAYDGSRLKGFLEALNLPQFAGERLKEGLAAQTDPQEARNRRFGVDLLTAIAKSPTAVYIGPLDFSVDPAKPAPRLALVTQLGKDLAGRVAPPLDAGMQRNHKAGDPPVGAVAAGEFLVVFVGDVDLSSRLTGAAPADSLAKTPAFQKALAQLGPDALQAAAMVYMDGQSTVQVLIHAGQANPKTKDRELLAPLADGMGLNSLQQVAWAGNLESVAGAGAGSGGWQGTTFVGMRDRRVGLLALLDNPPLTQDSLKLIPKSATSAGAFRFDGNRLVADINALAARVDETAPKRIESTLHEIYVWTGVDLNRELFPAFGSEFVYYSTPEATGSSMWGYTVVNRLRQVKKAESAMGALENYINLQILQRDPGSKAQFQTRPLPAPYEKVTAHMLPMEVFTPCWAINKDTFYFSLSLPGLQAAMDMAEGKAPSIVDNPQFVALRRKLAPAGSAAEAFSSFSFADLGAGFPEVYNLGNLILAGALAKSGNPQEAYVAPPLNRVMPTLGPALSVYWSDAQGLHGKETGPFPLAGMLTPTQYLPLVVRQQAQARAKAKAAETQPAATNTGLP